jgi:hypothetical protein
MKTILGLLCLLPTLLFGESITLTKWVPEEGHGGWGRTYLPECCVDYLDGHYSSYQIVSTNFNEEKHFTYITMTVSNAVRKPALLGNHYFPESSTVDLRQYALDKSPVDIKAEIKAIAHQKRVETVKEVAGAVFIGIPMLILLGIGFLVLVVAILFFVCVALNPNENILVRIGAGYMAYKLGDGIFWNKDK